MLSSRKCCTEVGYPTADLEGSWMRGRDAKRRRDVKSGRGKSPAVSAMAVSASATTKRTGGGKGGGGGGGGGGRGRGGLY